MFSSSIGKCVNNKQIGRQNEILLLLLRIHTIKIYSLSQNISKLKNWTIKKNCAAMFIRHTVYMVPPEFLKGETVRLYGRAKFCRYCAMFGFLNAKIHNFALFYLCDINFHFSFLGPLMFA